MADCIFCRTNECPFCKARSASSSADYTPDLHSMPDSDLARSSYGISGAGEYKTRAMRHSGVLNIAGNYNAQRDIYSPANSQSNSRDYSGGEHGK
jgi:hypothetical protein